MNYARLILFAIILILSGCKKEEDPVDPCTNGFQDPGEEAPDCGGNCDPCPVVYIPSLYMEINSAPVSMTSRTLYYNGNAWSLQLANDSISMQIGLGTDGSIQTTPINPAGTYFSMHGISYPNQANGIYSISQHNSVDKVMSGFFRIDFVQQGSTDTLRIRNGSFSDFSY